MKDCDRADGTPVACIVAWRDAPERSTARIARQNIVRSAERSRLGIVGTMLSPARPGERPYARALRVSVGTPSEHVIPAPHGTISHGERGAGSWHPSHRVAGGAGVTPRPGCHLLSLFGRWIFEIRSVHDSEQC